MADNERIEYDPEAVLEFIDEHFEPYKKNHHGELVLRCPFCEGGQHEEISFNINLDSGVARCWRANKCAYAGTVVHMVKEYLGCDWDTAYNICGGQAPEDLDEILGILARAKGALRPSDFNPEKFKEQTVIDVFPKNAVPVYETDKFDEVVNWIQNWRWFDYDRFEESHDLYISKYTHRFQGRVIFKVQTNNNRAYLAYAYEDGVEPKTLNPPGEILSKMLYNYNEAKLAKVVFVVEGIFDAARLIERGLFPVAIFGCNLSVEQIFLLSETKAEEIVICLDNGAERLAYDMAKEMAEYIDDKTISVMEIDVPDADPDDLAEDGFWRCFKKRRRLLRKKDRLDSLVHDLGV